MKLSATPFNLTGLLNLTPDKLKAIRPVTSLDIFDQTKTNFHEDGLYSVSIFGKVGDKLREKRFSYIDIKAPIFHPNIWRALYRLKALYTEILEGTSYAVWDASISDFVKTTAAEGETGYSFFLKHWEKIKYTENKSITREEAIKLIEKFKSIALTSKIVVLPAGLRELEFDGGRVSEDEINDYYRRLLSISNTLTEQALKTNPQLVDRSRLSLQRAFNELYDYIESILKGKKKFIQGKWASRRIFNSTRNVLTAMPSNLKVLGDPLNPDLNTAQAGLYQMMAAAAPITKYQLRTGFLSKVFSSPSAPVRLVNKKTLRMEELQLDSSYYDMFMTDEGLDKLLGIYANDDIRHKPVEIEGRYLGLIYKGDDGTFKLFQDITELPARRNKEDVSPITYTELFYCSLYRVIERYPAMLVRYPIAGLTSCRFNKVRLKVTDRDERREELGEDWIATGHVANTFPIRGSSHVQTMSPSSWSLAGLSADFDGDTGSFIMALTDEAVQEVEDYQRSRRAYVSTDNQFFNSTSTELTELVFHNLTRYN